jgi:predicted Rossmann fold nucleotide-binding protein DprA/Smf involved in DNA uptake
LIERGAAKPGTAAARARQLYRQRRQRDEALGSALFGEPAWDLLLQLFVARAEQRPVSIMSVSIAAGLSRESVLAWVSRLEEHGLVERLGRDTSEQLMVVAITNDGFARMTRLFGPEIVSH